MPSSGFPKRAARSDRGGSSGVAGRLGGFEPIEAPSNAGHARCWLQVRHFDLVTPPISDANSDRFHRWQREAGKRYGQAVKLLHDLTKMEERRVRRPSRRNGTAVDCVGP
ncbi:MAG: hypothetical protein RIC12_00795 [Pirellulales bacterium]